MGGYAVVLAVAALSTYALTFAARRLARRIGAVVAPGERRVHLRPTPLGGGAAMFVAFLAAMGVASRLPQFEGLFASSKPAAVVLAGAVIFAVGLLDDLRPVSAPAKLAGQVLAGSVLYLLGVSMLFFRVPFAGAVSLSPDWIPLVTVLWVVVIANAINLIDGLDGLAAGVVAIAAGAFFLFGETQGVLATDNLGPLVAVVALGACLGFLPHNFHPARVFMGDAGALFLGLLLAASTIELSGQNNIPFSGRTFFYFAPVFIPFVILGVPVVDFVFAVVRRAVRRRGLATADAEHLHHRLVRLGHGQRRSVLILWAWTAVLSALALYPTYTGRGNAVVLPGIAAMAVALFTLFAPGVRRAPGVDRSRTRAVPMSAEGAPAALPRARLSPSRRRRAPSQRPALADPGPGRPDGVAAPERAGGLAPPAAGTTLPADLRPAQHRP